MANRKIRPIRDRAQLTHNKEVSIIKIPRSNFNASHALLNSNNITPRLIVCTNHTTKFLSRSSKNVEFGALRADLSYQ